MLIDQLRISIERDGERVGPEAGTLAAAKSALLADAGDRDGPSDYDLTATDPDGHPYLHSIRIRAADGQWYAAGDMVAPGQAYEQDRMYPAGDSQDRCGHCLRLALGFATDHRERILNEQEDRMRDEQHTLRRNARRNPTW